MKSKIALITGITGQDGSYLAEFLLKKGYIVHGLRRRSTVENLDNLKNINFNPQYKNKKFFLHYGDITDGSNLNKILKEIQPNEIYNLAAQSHVHLSFKIPEYTAEVNSLGVLRILEAIKNNNLKAKFYQASTSEMFGDIKNKSVIDHNTPFNPCSPYAISKLYSHFLVKNYREIGLFGVNGILFNHESPRRSSNFVTMKIIEAAIRIRNNNQDILYLGNLNSYRDWGYAKEYVEAMWLMLNQPIARDYMLATGKTYTVRNFVEKVFKKLGMQIEWKGRGLKEVGINKDTNKSIIKIDPYYFRPSEVSYLKGNAVKTFKQLNWRPKTNLNQLIDIMINSKI